jgi:hypothetical protein
MTPASFHREPSVRRPAVAAMEGTSPNITYLAESNHRLRGPLRAGVGGGSQRPPLTNGPTSLARLCNDDASHLVSDGPDPPQQFQTQMPTGQNNF